MAIPAQTHSAPSSRAPVSARNWPSRPPSRDKCQPPPTSGNRPMPLSGMAKRVFSVATRYLHGSAIPTPPPMVMPSMNATIGLPYSNIWWLSRYSSWKNLRPLFPPSLSAEWRRRLMSPPAQKPRPSAWSRMTASTASSSAQPASAALMPWHMSSVRACSALGRLSEIWPVRPCAWMLRFSVMGSSHSAAGRGHWRSKSRPTIMRMTWLVPSRIECTRRSRQKRSIGYSLR